VDGDPYAVDVPRLPASLAEAVDALEGDSFYRKAFGDTFIDYLVKLKRAEVKRYEHHLAELADAGTPVADPHATVTDWETREYFEFY
jgi:glutamine synthetase